MPERPKTSTTKKPEPAAQAAPPAPRKRLFWVPLDDPLEDDLAAKLETFEDTYQEALSDLMETLKQEEPASQPPPRPHDAEHPPASPTEPSPDDLAVPLRLTSQHSVPPGSEARMEAQPQPKSTQPESAQPPATIQRLRVRRDLPWPEEYSKPSEH